MTQAAAIYLPQDGGLVGLRDGQAMRLEPADLHELGPMLAIVPGEDVLIVDASVPPVRQATRRYQAARYALEDQLATPVDELHLALGPRGAEGRQPAAVVERDRMEAWLETFGDERANVTAGLIPDYLCLPEPQADTGSLWLMGRRGLFRADACHGFAGELDLLAAMLQAPSLPSRLQVRVQADTDADALLDGLREQGCEVTVVDRPEPDDMLADLLAGAPGQPAMNLLQDRYAPVSPMDQWWRPFRATAALAAVWLALAVTAQGVHYFELKAQHERLQQRAESRFREAFPNVQSINNIRVQAEEEIRSLRSQRGTDGLFPLLTATARAAGGVPGLNVNSLQYRNGELFLSMRGENVQTVEKLRAGFRESGSANLEVQSADASSEGVEIRARISREAT